MLKSKRQIRLSKATSMLRARSLTTAHPAQPEQAQPPLSTPEHPTRWTAIRRLLKR